MNISINENELFCIMYTLQLNTIKIAELVDIV